MGRVSFFGNEIRAGSLKLGIVRGDDIHSPAGERICTFDVRTGEIRDGKGRPLGVLAGDFLSPKSGNRIEADALDRFVSGPVKSRTLKAAAYLLFNDR